MKNKLTCWSDSLVGKLGFSFTSDSMKSVAQAVFKYKNENNIDVICVGYDQRYLADELALEIANSLSNMGVPVKVIDGPSPMFLISWFANQIDKGSKSLGVYVGGDSAPMGLLNVSFRNTDGSPFTSTQTRKLYEDYLYYSRGNFDFVDKKRELEYADLKEGYTQWLVDTLNLTPYLGKNPTVIGIDYLTSPVCSYLQPLFTKMNLGISAVPESFYDRLIINKQLRPDPSGWSLHYGFKSFGMRQINFAFDGDGDCLGLYDGKADEEISPSAVFIILLYYFAKVKKRKGTILIDKAVSDRVTIIAEQYGMAVEYVNNGLAGLSEKLKKSRKRPALMYGDAYGGFWFKGLPLDRNPFPAILFIIEACVKAGLNPSSLYATIVDKHLNKDYFYGKVDIYPKQVDFDQLFSFLQEGSTAAVGENKIIECVPGEFTDESHFTAHTMKLDNDSRIVIQSNPKNDFIELYVEAIDKDTTHRIMGNVQNLIFISDHKLIN